MTLSQDFSLIAAPYTQCLHKRASERAGPDAFPDNESTLRRHPRALNYNDREDIRRSESSQPARHGGRPAITSSTHFPPAAQRSMRFHRRFPPPSYHSWNCTGVTGNRGNTTPGTPGIRGKGSQKQLHSLLASTNGENQENDLNEIRGCTFLSPPFREAPFQAAGAAQLSCEESRAQPTGEDREATEHDRRTCREAQSEN